MIQVIIKYGRPVLLAVRKAAGSIPPISWIWGTSTGSNWGSLSNRGWGVPTSATAPANITPPSITGTAVVDQTLTINGGTWSAVPYILRYDIYRDTTLITSIATSSSSINYTIPASFAGSNLKCTVSAINSAGSASADSNTLAVLATLLDLYPNAAAAYSVRLLRGAHYTSSAIRVRRSNDNAELNIGFTASGNLDTTAVLAFVGSNSGFISTWYDQSGNARNFNQTTPTAQPLIVQSGVLVTLNTKPAISFNGTSHFVETASSVLANTFTVYGVASTPSGSGNGVLCTQYNIVDDGRTLFYLNNNTTRVIGLQIGTSVTVTGTVNNNQMIAYYSKVGTNVNVARNNESLTNGTILNNPQNAPLRIGGFLSPVTSFTSQIENELIIYNTDVSSNRAGTLTNINTYYGVY